jgi:hypothetical protein
MHIFMAAIEREVLVEFPRVPSRAQHRIRLAIVCPV